MSTKPNVLRKSEPSPEMVEAMKKRVKERDDYIASRSIINAEGEAALRRLLPIAQGDSGQCRHVAAFLLGLYNGRRFPFDLVSLRGLDLPIFNDCMAVLLMDHCPELEVHMYFEQGNDEAHTIFEGLAKRWGIKDHMLGTGGF